VGTGSLVLPYRVDNVQVNVVPEPGPIGLLALGACWLIRSGVARADRRSAVRSALASGLCPAGSIP
jgi:hypothetical protein